MKARIERAVQMYNERCDHIILLYLVYCIITESVPEKVCIYRNIDVLVLVANIVQRE